MGEAATVLIAVKDTVLADSLRFSLELEGYDARLCALPFEPAAHAAEKGCLLLDQDVFSTMMRVDDGAGIERLEIPTVLMVNQRTQRVLDYAKAAGVASIVEKPLLGGVLFDTIRMVLEADGAMGKE